jgi:putative SOS response-associated peptidase YedK
MPLILKPEAFDEWLDPGNTDTGKLERLLKTAYQGELECYPVSKRVNHVGNNSRDYMLPLRGDGASGSTPNAAKKSSENAHDGI